ncbi:hypothetical protein, partial [Acetobacter tropicalis]|uniref:hypothetical protein n=1 Tax=Acetobacter tropicalis TaxID=104102 RepID=UPI0005876D75
IPVLTSVAEAQTNAEVVPKTPTKTGKAKKAQAKTATKAAPQPTAAASTTTSATVTPAASATQSQATSTDQNSVASKVMKQAYDTNAGTESNTENVTVTGSRLLQNRLTN